MNERQINLLVKRWIAVQMTSASPVIHIRSLESDGRKQSKFERELIQSGYLNVVDGDFLVTSKAFDEVKDTELDLVSIWKETLSQWNDRSDYVEAVRQSDLSPEQVVFVLKNSDNFKFYIMIENEVNYRRVLTEKIGPLKLSEVTDAYKDLDKQLGFSINPCIMISSDNLELFAQKHALEEKVNRLVAANLAWGLEDQGIFEKGENEVARNGQEDPVRVIYSAPADGLFFNSYGNLADDPAQWNENLDSAIKRSVDRINELQRNLTMLRKARKGIDDLGGMEKFISTLRSKITIHVEKNKK